MSYSRRSTQRQDFAYFRRRRADFFAAFFAGFRFAAFFATFRRAGFRFAVFFAALRAGLRFTAFFVDLLAVFRDLFFVAGIVI